MKQYLIHAWDGQDENAMDRRMQVREQHLLGAKKLKANGNFILGGAMLNDEGKMIVSTLILQFEGEADFEAWKNAEIYLLKKVWERIEIYPFKVAEV